jgi:hypothetical protein
VLVLQDKIGVPGLGESEIGEFAADPEQWIAMLDQVPDALSEG